MKITQRDLCASGLPNCWATAYEVLRSDDALRQAVLHTTRSLDQMPSCYRWLMAAALRLFPAAFYAVTRRHPSEASAPAVEMGLGRLRAVPGFAELLRVTTSLALYGALDGRVGQPGSEALR